MGAAFALAGTAGLVLLKTAVVAGTAFVVWRRLTGASPLLSGCHHHACRRWRPAAHDDRPSADLVAARTGPAGADPEQPSTYRQADPGIGCALRVLGEPARGLDHRRRGARAARRDQERAIARRCNQVARARLGKSRGDAGQSLRHRPLGVPLDYGSIDATGHFRMGALQSARVPDHVGIGDRTDGAPRLAAKKARDSAGARGLRRRRAPRGCRSACVARGATRLPRLSRAPWTLHRESLGQPRASDRAIVCGSDDPVLAVRARAIDCT